ncbi:amidohydrolase family protein [Acrocarpospora macrocephala]|uniref:Amidohydrolase n=1 Tax=Acrocarpospora macrocephala TaxID=150177 RepID=A0A5M3X3S8_9ACTN|nr:amidohydrolase family protein [Acrocarpospora macrocephala]GES14759.1 amidohydrolase [Acrocarpospora macrocephala]
MEILDAQIHCWRTDHPTRPWVKEYRPGQLPSGRNQFLIHAGQSADPETVLIAMAEVGVDGGILTPVGVYGEQSDFELTAAARFPRKFGVVGWIDHLAGDVEDQLAADAGRGLLGVRILGLREPGRHERGEFTRVLGACRALGLAVAFSLAHPVDPRLVAVLREYGDLRFMIDHLGVGLAPPLLGAARPERPWEHLDAVLGLAEIPNVSLKLTGAPSLSSELFPFRDLWDPIRRLLDAYGVDRVMWGSDFTRTNGLHSYWEGTHYLSHIPGLDTDALSLLYGGTLRSLLGWDRADPAPAS